MRIIRFLSPWMAISLAAASLPASAQLSPYVFGGAGNLSQNDSATVMRAGLGVEASAIPLVTPSIEASYLHSGDVTGTVVNGKVNWPIGVIGLTPYVKGGMAKLEVNNAQSKTGATVGAGIEIDLFDWGFRLEADHYSVAGASNASTVTGNVLYRF